MDDMVVSLTASDHWWGSLVISTLVVLIGVIVEAVADLTKWLDNCPEKKSIEIVAVMALIVGIAGELLGEGKTIALGDQISGYLNLKSDKLEADNLALKAKIAPRRLSGEQRKKISQLPSDPFPELIVVSREMDPEGQDFADDFVEALKDANWNVGPSSKDWLLSKKGIFIGFVGEKPKGFDELAHALDGAAIKYTPMEISSEYLHTIARGFKPGVLYLIVGAKP